MAHYTRKALTLLFAAAQLMALLPALPFTQFPAARAIRDYNGPGGRRRDGIGGTCQPVVGEHNGFVEYGFAFLLEGCVSPCRQMTQFIASSL